METKTVTLIPGDGIGKEICESVLQIIHAVRAPIVWEYATAGQQALMSGEDIIPQKTLNSIAKNGVALKGLLPNSFLGRKTNKLNVTVPELGV